LRAAIGLHLARCCIGPQAATGASASCQCPAGSATAYPAQNKHRRAARIGRNCNFPDDIADPRMSEPRIFRWALHPQFRASEHVRLRSVNSLLPCRGHARLLAGNKGFNITGTCFHCFYGFRLPGKLNAAPDLIAAGAAGDLVRLNKAEHYEVAVVAAQGDVNGVADRTPAAPRDAATCA
jgi:hypothetical protein